MKHTYQRKLTFSFLAIFAIFTVGIVIFEQRQARQYKTEALRERLDAYADLARNYIAKNAAADSAGWAGLLEMLPGNLRLTWVAGDGKVIFDNLISETETLENHGQRPEITQARSEGRGSDIRTSASNSRPYLYYAKYYGNGFIRVALPYDIEVQNFIEPGNGFLYFIVVLFILGFLFIYYVGGRFGRSMRQLRDFSLAVSNGELPVEKPHFPDDELGEVGRQLVSDYQLLKEGQTKLSLEREKLWQHVQSSAEGICFFNADDTVAFYNGLFIQYLNIISDNIDENMDIRNIGSFAPALDFMQSGAEGNYFETMIGRSGREFFMRLNKFDDGSFEIVLNDITQQEKSRKMKKEMTGNIAHELRTPVTSIRGFLETILENKLDPAQQKDFLEKAYNQTLSLSEIIRDMGLLTKIEGSPAAFDMEPLRLSAIMDGVTAELQEKLVEHGIHVSNDLPSGLTVTGNGGLINSVLRNLTENTIKHAGQNVEITVREIGRKDGYVYISFADNGKGISDQAQLKRLFERFYRAD